MLEFEKSVIGPGRMQARVALGFDSDSDRRDFEHRLADFLAADPRSSNVIDWRSAASELTWHSSHALPMAGPIGHLLVFGNPTADSSYRSMMFAGEGEGQSSVHRVWRVLTRVGLIPATLGLNSAEINRYLAFPPPDSNRIGLCSFVSLPSPASGDKYVGVAGVRRLLGTARFRSLLNAEASWLLSCVVPRLEPASKMLAFQVDAWRHLDELVAIGRLNREVIRMPPTRMLYSAQSVAALARLVRGEDPPAPRTAQ